MPSVSSPSERTLAWASSIAARGQRRARTGSSQLVLLLARFPRTTAARPQVSSEPDRASKRRLGAERERGELLTEPPALHLADGPREPAGAGDMVSEVRSRANRCLLEAAGRRGERWPRRGEGQLVLSHRRREWRRERARRQTHRSSAPSCVCLSCTGSERVWPMVVEVREEGDDEASCGGQGASWTGRRAMVLQGELGAGCWLA